MFADRMCKAQAIQWLCENTDTDEGTDATETTCETVKSVAASAIDSASKDPSVLDDVGTDYAFL